MAQDRRYWPILRFAFNRGFLGWMTNARPDPFTTQDLHDHLARGAPLGKRQKARIAQHLHRLKSVRLLRGGGLGNGRYYMTFDALKELQGSYLQASIAGARAPKVCFVPQDTRRANALTMLLISPGLQPSVVTAIKQDAILQGQLQALWDRVGKLTAEHGGKTADLLMAVGRTDVKVFEE